MSKILTQIHNQLVDGAKKVDVSSFKINDKEIKGTGVVMDQTIKDFDESGYATLPVDSISIDFAAADGTKIEPNDTYKGTIHNTLYNVYNEAIK